MKWIWESRKMWKNRWSKVWLESRAQRLQPASWWGLGNASSKLWPCLALESRKWMRGGQGRDTVRGALSDDLGFAVEHHVIWYFLQCSWGNQPAQGQAQNGLEGAWGRWRPCWSSRLSKDYTRKNSNAIRHRRDRDEHWRKGWRRRLGEVQRREDHQKGERRNKVLSFFSPWQW